MTDIEVSIMLIGLWVMWALGWLTGRRRKAQ